MPKLYYRYGAVSSRKTSRLLTEIFQYNEDKDYVAAILIKPDGYARDGASTVSSRVPGLTRESDLVLKKGDPLS